MSRIYSSTNKIKFTDIPEKYAVPRQFRAKQSDVHSAVITYVFDHFQNTNRYKQKVIDALNCLTYCVLQNDPPPVEWSSKNPLVTMPDMDLELVEETLRDLYLVIEAIEWDVPISSEMDDLKVAENTVISSLVQSSKKISPGSPKREKEQIVKSVSNKPLHQFKEEHKIVTTFQINSTPKEDLYIQSPKYPRFDINKVWMSSTEGGDTLTIYTTLPEVPTKQNEISITTNVEAMTESELMRLYPNHIIHTRSPKMYEKYPGLDYDEDIGVIFPVGKYTKEQIIDNIICYPHLYKLKKVNDEGKTISFYSTIEIDGSLVPIGDVWDELPESTVIPRDSEFAKEYVVRRYLLEEQSGIEHNYKMLGSLDPFLTLFMPIDRYIERGYVDTVSIAKQCVQSRVRYKQSRSPILRRLNFSV